MAISAVSFGIDRPAWLRLRSRAGLCRFRRWLLVGALLAMMLVPISARAGSISLTLSGGLNFLDADPDLVPTVGPEIVTLEVKAVGKRDVTWSLTLIADSDLQSGSDIIPITVISWTAFPNPPYTSGTLSTVVPKVIASGLTHEHDIITFDFYMQNSWTYNSGSYSSTATFTLSAP